MLRIEVLALVEEVFYRLLEVLVLLFVLELIVVVVELYELVGGK